ncbi:MAG: aminomethyl transferase family protein [Acidobacteria bacterium]|nr:MAG: aminomethyl transferase family protein [Acidobacteriota bacterium]
MAIGTPFHPRTSALNASLDWRHWSGYFAAGRYQDFHQVEYAAIRNSVALIDVSPLFKYELTGPGAERLVDRVITRDATKLRVGQVFYAPWCDERGKVLQEGTVMRLGPERFQWNAAEPIRRWLEINAGGLEVEIAERSAELAALAVQGPLSRRLLAEVAGDAVARLRFFRLCESTIDGVPVVVSRTGYTGDLGYEVWLPAAAAPRLWDVLIAAGRPYGAIPCGLKAMDVARIEAGFVLIGVDYVSADHARIPDQLSSPYEIGLGWAVSHKKKTPYVGRAALEQEKRHGSSWRLVGLEIDWQPLEQLYASAGLMPELPLEAWRTPVPVYHGRRQVGRATSGCWSTLLKKYVALASVESASAGGPLEMEVTVDYARRRAPARVVKLPFFRPPRMRA